ncbi:hypothetical protein FB45DRAFT_902044 [Roridomyces roridus]|uniref:Uncharacterized protein n=1 Tax=Roridomyces roridus TaxID=1738132 RepID=A0AAD7FW87_9AGAR|nr:hypothetical protein FB45DRAFT_902044 [Roridomyces roridus]
MRGTSNGVRHCLSPGNPGASKQRIRALLGTHPLLPDGPSPAHWYLRRIQRIRRAAAYRRFSLSSSPWNARAPALCPVLRCRLDHFARVSRPHGITLPPLRSALYRLARTGGVFATTQRYGHSTRRESLEISCATPDFAGPAFWNVITRNARGRRPETPIRRARDRAHHVRAPSPGIHGVHGSTTSGMLSTKEGVTQMPFAWRLNLPLQSQGQDRRPRRCSLNVDSSKSSPSLCFKIRGRWYKGSRGSSNYMGCTTRKVEGGHGTAGVKCRILSRLRIPTRVVGKMACRDS